MVPVVVTDPAVSAPVEENEPARRVPVTVAALATNAPTTDVVVVASDPMTTEEAITPMRTIPAVVPVPASSTKSPPVEPEAPAPWPSK